MTDPAAKWKRMMELISRPLFFPQKIFHPTLNIFKTPLMFYYSVTKVTFLQQNLKYFETLLCVCVVFSKSKNKNVEITQSVKVCPNKKTLSPLHENEKIR